VLSFNTLACFCRQLLKPSRFNRLGLAAAAINGSNRPLRHFDAMEATETSVMPNVPAAKHDDWERAGSTAIRYVMLGWILTKRQNRPA
jgi:hypothetical protein